MEDSHLNTNCDISTDINGDNFNDIVLGNDTKVDTPPPNSEFIDQDKMDTSEVVIEDRENELKLPSIQDSNGENEENIESFAQDGNHNTVVYNFNEFALIATSKKVFSSQNTFLKGCKWSPDGSCLLTNSDDNVLRLFDLPTSFYCTKTLNSSDCSLSELGPSLAVPETGLVYDYAWYPFMSSSDPATCCFISTNSNNPVHLWDAYTGKLRGTYRGFNDVDEVTAAYSVVFNSTGDKIFCGYKNEVKMFDVSRPGRDCIRFKTKGLANQKGIISCLDNNPAMESLFAAGSYRKSLGLYTTENECVCLLLGHSRGLTQVSFSPDGSCLYSAARNDKEILCWDLRNPGSTLMSLSRPHLTNQRIYFDVSSDGEYLISGSTDGNIRVWNVKKATKHKPEPDFIFKSTFDCLNGVSLHKQLPIVATATGQRHFPDINSDAEDSTIFLVSSLKNKIENSIKIWSLGAAG